MTWFHYATSVSATKADALSKNSEISISDIKQIQIPSSWLIADIGPVRIFHTRSQTIRKKMARGLRIGSKAEALNGLRALLRVARSRSPDKSVRSSKFAQEILAQVRPRSAR